MGYSPMSRRRTGRQAEGQNGHRRDDQVQAGRQSDPVPAQGGPDQLAGSGPRGARQPRPGESGHPGAPATWRSDE
jgi:hypothetical protein